MLFSDFVFEVIQMLKSSVVLTGFGCAKGKARVQDNGTKILWDLARSKILGEPMGGITRDILWATL